MSANQLNKSESAAFALNDQEYQALLESSPTFRGYSSAEKTAILSASDEKRQTYIEIFSEEMADRRAAAEAFLNRNEQILRDGSFEAKKQKTATVLKQENSQSQQELNSVEQLINNI